MKSRKRCRKALAMEVETTGVAAVRKMAGRKRMEEEESSAAVDMEVERMVSSDDEIDYSVKPDFFDPNLDDKDALWVHKQRHHRASDAILSCPACFTTLCLDCQRHEKYVTRYRAMFVFNCKVSNEVTQQVTSKTRKPKHLGKSGESSIQYENNEVVRQVCCSVCATEVGVYDQDGVYHFFHVLPSNS